MTLKNVKKKIKCAADKNRLKMLRVNKALMFKVQVLFCKGSFTPSESESQCENELGLAPPLEILDPSLHCDGFFNFACFLLPVCPINNCAVSCPNGFTTETTPGGCEQCNCNGK